MRELAQMALLGCLEWLGLMPRLNLYLKYLRECVEWKVCQQCLGSRWKALDEESSPVI